MIQKSGPCNPGQGEGGAGGGEGGGGEGGGEGGAAKEKTEPHLKG